VPDLLSKLSEEVTSRSTPGGRGSPWPPASEAEVASFEQRIGARLPALWREIFTTIGNGGFGPGGPATLRIIQSIGPGRPGVALARPPGAYRALGVCDSVVHQRVHLGRSHGEVRSE
jgi:hypothetical protein